jgi:hypothetical protein
VLLNRTAHSAEPQAQALKAPLSCKLKLFGSCHSAIVAAMLRLANAFYQRGEYSRAERVCLRALKLSACGGAPFPRLLELLRLHGMTLRKMNRPRDTQRAYCLSWALQAGAFSNFQSAASVNN